MIQQAYSHGPINQNIKHPYALFVFVKESFVWARYINYWALTICNSNSNTISNTKWLHVVFEQWAYMVWPVFFYVDLFSAVRETVSGER